jgi:putative ABC transport system permease protein
MTQIVRDARFGLRLLWRNPGFTTVAVLALALGIGANTAIFSVVHATLLAPLPFHDPEQLVMVWSKVQTYKNVTAAATFLDWKKQATVFQDLNAWSGGGVGLSTDGTPEQVITQFTTPGLVSMMGHRFLLGRDFAAEEGEVGKDKVIILTHRLWEAPVRVRPRHRRQTGAGGRRAPHRGGRAGHRSRRPRQPGAVQAPHLQARADQPRLPLAARHGAPEAGGDAAQANANMDQVTSRIAELNPRSNKGWSATVEPLQNNFLSKETIAGLWLLLGAVGVRAADRLRERREPAPRARHGAAEGSRGALLPGRPPRADLRAVPHRERRASRPSAACWAWPWPRVSCARSWP